MLPNLTPSDVARIWSKVAPPDAEGCRYWTDCTSHGYGRITIGGRTYAAHRVIFLLSGGVLSPDKPYVCHRCNHPSCCEPTHLHAGSQADNMRYMAECGRGGDWERARGDAHWTRTKPEWLARGERSGARTHPERMPRGDRHGSRLHPERLVRGEQHWSRANPERVLRGEQANGVKLTESDVRQIRAMHAQGWTIAALGRHFTVSESTIRWIVQGKTWRHVT